MAADNVSVIAWPQNVNTPVWPCTEIGFCRSLSDEKLNSGPDSLWSIKSHLRVRVLTPVSWQIFKHGHLITLWYLIGSGFSSPLPFSAFICEIDGE